MPNTLKTCINAGGNLPEPSTKYALRAYMNIYLHILLTNSGVERKAKCDAISNET